MCSSCCMITWMLKSMFFESILNGTATDGSAEWRKISKNIDVSVWGTKITHTNIFYWGIFPFLEHVWAVFNVWAFLTGLRFSFFGGLEIWNLVILDFEPISKKNWGWKFWSSKVWREVRSSNLLEEFNPTLKSGIAGDIIFDFSEYHGTTDLAWNFNSEIGS